MDLNTSPLRVIAISIATVFVVTTAGFAAFLVACPSCEFSNGNWLLAFFAANAVVLAFPGWIVMVVGLWRIIKNIFMMATQVNDEFQEAHWAYHFNRFNLVFAPRYLNEYGLVARSKLFGGLVTFLFGISMSLPLILVQELSV